MPGDKPIPGPWGTRNDEIDSLKRREALPDDAQFIEGFLKSFEKSAIQLAVSHGLTIEVDTKKGVPGILTLTQLEGDIFILCDKIKEWVGHANGLSQVKDRNITFKEDFVPVGKNVIRPSIIISGITTRKA